MKNEIETPGFYWDINSEEIVAVKYQKKKPTIDELLDALQLLNELKYYYTSSEKLAHAIKWGIIAPFGYVRKYVNEYMPYLCLQGAAGSGKSALGRILLYLYGEPVESYNDIGGGGFNTEARMGQHVQKTTFPIIVNEPGSIFENEKVLEMLKNVIELRTARSKFQGRIFVNIPAFTTAIFTSNKPLPPDDAIQRRFSTILFTHKERKTEQEKKIFEQKFKIKNPQKSPLHKLKAIQHFAIGEIVKDHNLLLKDWKECADIIVKRLFYYLDQEVPEWLKQWGEEVTLEDIDEEHIEEIRMFFIEEINKKSRLIKLYDETGRPSENETLIDNEEINRTKDFHQKVWNVINEGLLPYAVLYHNSKGDHVCFKAGMKKYLNKYTNICEPLTSICELLGWKYTSVRIPKKTKVMKVKFDKFLSFIYPEMEIVENVIEDKKDKTILYDELEDYKYEK